ncbi:hypothetical protein L7F22_022670 [Adiantum nelumboides]|nr:hypothetical protein [Adiantum nelumboides]
MEELKEEEEKDGEAVKLEWEGENLDCTALFKDILSYVLFTHHQIPQPLPQLECSAFENIVVEHTTDTSASLSERREQNRKTRAAKKEVKSRAKLMASIQALLAALQGALKELLDMPSVLLVLGPSTKQPFAVYDIQFYRIRAAFPSQDMQGLSRSSNLEILTRGLAKKITRALVSQDSGPLFTGPMKLFLFIKADAMSCTPQDFVPKRGYVARFRKKQGYLRVIRIIGTSSSVNQGDVDPLLMDESKFGCNDMIWFQCKLNIKGGQCHDIL